MVSVPQNDHDHSDTEGSVQYTPATTSYAGSVADDVQPPPTNPKKLSHKRSSRQTHSVMSGADVAFRVHGDDDDSYAELEDS